MPAGKELLLGTVFKGRVDPAFKKAINDLKTALAQYNNVMNQVGSNASKATSRVRAFGNAVKQSKNKVKDVNKEALEPFNKQISRARNGYQRFLAAMKVTAAYGVAATAIYKVTQAFRAGIKEIVDYDQALKNIQAITGATTQEIQAMDDTIRDVARSTKFSTTEIAEGVTLLGQAGFSAEESMQAIHASSLLATGTLSDLKTTVDLVTTTIRAYNLDASEAARVSDVMANAINRSKLTIDKLRVSFNFVGATAAQAGLSIEQTAATMMVLANNGLRASTIGTGFRQVLSRLIAPTRKIRELMEEHNVELEKINPLTQGWESALKNLTQTLYDSERGAIDVQKAFELFGLRGAQAVSIIAKSFVSGDFQRALGYAYEIGTAAEMAGIQAEGLALKFKRLQDRSKLVAVAIGDAGLTGAMKGMLDILLSLAETFESFVRSELGQAATNFVLLTSAIVGTSLALKGLIGVLKIAGIGAFLTNPLLAGVAAVSAFTAAMWQMSEGQKNAANEASELAIQAKGVALSVNVYREGLEQLHDSMAEEAPRQYEALLKRLIQEHPELAEKVDLTTISHEELIAVLRKFEFEQFSQSLNKVTESMGYYSDQVEKASIEVDKLQEGAFFKIKEGAAEVTEATDDLAFAQAKLNASLRQLEEGGRTYVDVLVSMVREKHRSKEAAESMLESFIKLNVQSGEVADSLRNRFQQSITAMNQTTIEMNRRISELLQDIPIQYQRMYSDLDALRQADLVNTIRSVNRQIAAFEKAADQLGIAGEKRRVAIEAIRQRELIDFLAQKEEEIKGEETTAQRRIEIIQDFRDRLNKELDNQIKEYQAQQAKLIAQENATGERRTEIEEETDERIQKARAEHTERLKALDILQNDLMKEVAEERLEIEIEANEQQLEERKRRNDKLNAMDELAVAQGKKTQLQALKDKLDREIEFLKEVLALRSKMVVESAKLYGEDSENYKEAIEKKKEAEHALEMATIERQKAIVEAEQKEQEALKKTQESAAKTVEKTKEVKRWYVRVKNDINSSPITVSADVNPAKAALNHLLEFYNTKVADAIVKYTKQLMDPFAIKDFTLKSQIESLTDKIQETKDVFEEDPFLRDIQSTLGNVFDNETTPSTSELIGDTGAPAGGGGGSTASGSMSLSVPKTQPVETVNLNINTRDRSYEFETVNRPGTRDQIFELGRELDRMDLSYG